MPASPDGSVLRCLEYGIIGGFAGTIVMDMVMVLTFVLAGQPGDAFFSMVGERMGDGVIAGILAHVLVGITGGSVFSLLVSKVAALHIDGMRKATALGLGAGALTIPLGCIPLAIWLGQPILGVIAFSILPHLVWGTVLGWTVGYGMLGRRS